MTQVKLSLEQILNSLSTLNEIGKKEDLPFSLSFKIAKICKELEPTVQSFQETKNKFIESNGQRNEESGQIEITDEEVKKKFLEEVSTLLKSESELNVELLKYSDFEDTRVSANQIRHIIWAIAED